MTHGQADFLIGLLAANWPNRELPADTRELWRQLLMQEPEHPANADAVRTILLRPGSGRPSIGDVVLALRQARTEHDREQQRLAEQLEQEEYDRIAIPPPPEARRALERIGIQLPKEDT